MTNRKPVKLGAAQHTSGTFDSAHEASRLTCYAPRATRACTANTLAGTLSACTINMNDSASSLLHVLQQHWQHSSFRPLQEEAVTATLEGKDLLLILPTGSDTLRLPVTYCPLVPDFASNGVDLTSTCLNLAYLMGASDA